MAKYRVEVTEILQHQEVIEAKSEEEAIEKLKSKYDNEEIILDYQHHTSTEFCVLEKVKKKEQLSR